MAKNKILNLDDFREQMVENMGGAGFDIPRTWVENGEERNEVFTIPHPLLVDDDVNDAITKANADTNNPGVAMAKAILNTDADPHVYDRFKRAGGKSGDVLMLWRGMMAEMQKNGFTLPK